ncbi:MAG: aspartate aminotransferase [Kiritimatiellia bacterium]|jgi:aspartate aminotransferase
MANALSVWFDNPNTLPERTKSRLAKTMQPSRILTIAGEVLALKAQGRQIANFTIGDFAPESFRVPPLFLQHLHQAQDDGQTFYPPSVGTHELRCAIRDYYHRHLGVDYPTSSVLVGSGARPLIYSAFACVTDPGDKVVYQVPSWNTEYYIELNECVGERLVATRENKFMLTADDLQPHLHDARLIIINSPQNPSGTAISEDSLRAICLSIVAENHRREQAGDRPLYLLYDMVYWQLTMPGVTHHTPVGLVPEMSKYTIMVDAISKSWAATGVRVGWCVAPPWLQGTMAALVGHMGAWAGRAPQIASANTLKDDTGMATWAATYREAIGARLTELHNGFNAMSNAGLPVTPVPPEGSLYFTAQFDIIGRTHQDQIIETDEHTRSALLHGAGVAVVPFITFGYPEGSGWMRFSIGAVSSEEIPLALARIRTFLESLK